MKYLVLFLLFISTAAFGQQLDYIKWKEMAKTEIRLLPKYGNLPKTEKQQEVDKQLINSYLKQEGTHQKASSFLVNAGFDYLYKGD